jgi:hypothetical protein
MTDPQKSPGNVASRRDAISPKWSPGAKCFFVISFCLSACRIQFLPMTDPPALSVIAASGPQSPKSIKAIWRLRVKPAMTGVAVISFCLSACKI